MTIAMLRYLILMAVLLLPLSVAAAEQNPLEKVVIVEPIRKLKSTRTGVTEAQFMKRFRQKIETQMSTFKETKETYETGVLVRLDKRGELLGATVEDSCGNEGADMAAVRAIYKCAPFGPLPESCNTRGMNMHFIVRFGGLKKKVTPPQAVAGTPPVSVASDPVKTAPAIVSKPDLAKPLDIEQKLKAREERLKLKSDSLKASIAKASQSEKVRMLRDLALCTSELHNYDEACKVLQEAASIENGINGESEEYGSILNQLAENYSKISRFDDAEKEYERSVTVLKKTSQQSGLLMEAMTNYAKILYKRGKDKEAESLYKEIKSMKVQ